MLHLSLLVLFFAVSHMPLILIFVVPLVLAIAFGECQSHRASDAGHDMLVSIQRQWRVPQEHSFVSFCNALPCNQASDCDTVNIGFVVLP